MIFRYDIFHYNKVKILLFGFFLLYLRSHEPNISLKITTPIILTENKPTDINNDILRNNCSSGFKESRIFKILKNKVNKGYLALFLSIVLTFIIVSKGVSIRKAYINTPEYKFEQSIRKEVNVSKEHLRRTTEFLTYKGYLSKTLKPQKHVVGVSSPTPNTYEIRVSYDNVHTFVFTKEGGEEWKLSGEPVHKEYVDNLEEVRIRYKAKVITEETVKNKEVK